MAAATLVVIPSATATIEPITVGWVCGKPPATARSHAGATLLGSVDVASARSNELHHITSTDRVRDTSIPASKFSAFDPETETGRASNPGAINCAGAP